MGNDIWNDIWNDIQIIHRHIWECENHIIFCLVFHFHPPWAIFCFHNPVALVCGGYVMIWFHVVRPLVSECLDRSQSNMSNFWIPPAIWTTSETTSERHPKSSQVIIDPFDPFWFSFLIWILRAHKKKARIHVAICKTTIHCSISPYLKSIQDSVWQY